MANQSKTNTFFKGIASSWKGMRLTIKHLLQAVRRRRVQDIQHPDYFLQKNGLATVTYPYETIPVPENGRYQLHNEIEDCIVCDKCAKICPVDCIDIEPIRSVGEFGKTSDGTSKRIYAARFDIDMAKCCFCGLCTTVCPTECLTMTPEYDFSTFDLTTMNFGFGNISEAEAEKKRFEWEQYQAEKAKNKAPENLPEKAEAGMASPGFRPRMAPKPNPVSPPPSAEKEIQKPAEEPAQSPARPRRISPVMGPKPSEENKEISPLEKDVSDPANETKPSKVSPIRNRPLMPPPKPPSEDDSE